MNGNIAVATDSLPMLFWGMLTERLQVQGCCCGMFCEMWHDVVANVPQGQALKCGPVVLLCLWLK